MLGCAGIRLPVARFLRAPSSPPARSRRSYAAFPVKACALAIFQSRLVRIPAIVGNILFY